jgi:hypothetical protein
MGGVSIHCSAGERDEAAVWCVEANGLQKLKNQGRIGLIIEGRIADGPGDRGAPRAIDHNLGVEVFEQSMEPSFRQ